MSPIFKAGVGPFLEVDRSDRAVPELQSAAVASRLPSFIGLEGSAPEILSALQLAIIGAGSVGERIADHIARWHPHTMWIVDPGNYKPESVLTHSISPARIGRPKALSVARRIKAISPATRVLVFEGNFQEADQLALWDANAVVLATDNLAVEVAVAEMCMHQGKLLLQGSVYGDGLVAQVRTITNRDPASPCLGCAFGEQDWQHFHRQTHFSCSGGNGPEPTMSTSALCSTAADMVATELLRLVLKLGPPATDSLLDYSGYPQTITRSPLTRKRECPCSHARWRLGKTPPHPICESTLTEFASFAQLAGELESFTFEVAGHDFVEIAVCCEMQPVRRFVATGATVGRCPQCGKPMSVPRASANGWVSAAKLGPLMEQPISALGGVSAPWVAVQSDCRAVVFADERSPI